MEICFLKHTEIDYMKWNECVDKSQNSLIYALSWYLDIVSPGWEALVSSDYQYVMPLPVKQKFGVKYLVQPILTQQLGVFSPLPIDTPTVLLFIRKIPYLSYALNINELNFSPRAVELPNYILKLYLPAGVLTQNFSKNTKRNIVNSLKHRLVLDLNIDTEVFLDFYFTEDINYVKPDQATTSKLIRALAQNQVLKIIGCKDADDRLISAVCLVHWKDRLIYLLPVSSKKGKETCAMFLIIQSVIELYSESNLLFDFEGSMIEGIARFYKGFGATNQPYYMIRRLRPHKLIKFLRKK